jgi:hypothetical protein
MERHLNDLQTQLLLHPTVVSLAHQQQVLLALVHLAALLEVEKAGHQAANRFMDQAVVALADTLAMAAVAIASPLIAVPEEQEVAAVAEVVLVMAIMEELLVAVLACMEKAQVDTVAMAMETLVELLVTLLLVVVVDLVEQEGTIRIALAAMHSIMAATMVAAVVLILPLQMLDKKVEMAEPD